jgi:ribosomal protein S18 acetylase RimI-like enzyme
MKVLEGYALYHFRGDPKINWSSADAHICRFKERLDEISALEKELFPHLFSSSTPDNRVVHTWDLEKKSNCVFFAVDASSGRIASFLFTKSQAGQIRLTSLGTDPSHRSRGLAGRLITIALGYHQMILKCSSASLGVHADAQAARRLYVNDGGRNPMLRFRVVHIVQNYYGGGGDAFKMEMDEIKDLPWDEGVSCSLNDLVAT